jgi:type II secretory pathway component PulK
MMGMRGSWPGLGNRGFVLIYVLWVGVAVTALVMFLSRDSRQVMKAESAFEAKMILRGEMANLRKIIRAYADRNLLNVPYRNVLGNCTVTVADANFFLNLNRATYDEIMRLCLAVGVEEDRAEVIADSLLDWIDNDVIARPNGAEDNYYQSLRPPYRCQNRSLRHYGELFLIRGMDRDTVEKVRRFISFKGKGINFQNAPLEVLFAVTGDWDMSERIVEYRREYNLDDEAMRMLVGYNLFNILLTRYTFEDSNIHRISISGRYQGVEERIDEWM